METRHWVDTAADCGYLGPGQAERLLADLGEIGRMLGGMMAKSGKFCGSLTDSG